MSAWSLPTTATVDGKETPIRSDFRAVLDALAALDDLDLTMPERAAACVRILYPEWKDIQDWDGAFKAAMEFINLGEPTPENQPPKAHRAVSRLSDGFKRLTARTKLGGKAVGHFGSRLREIALGALIFNGISKALRGFVTGMNNALTKSGAFTSALSNLKGAALNAAAPLVSALTPALTAIANAAAIALSYIGRLFAFFSGKSIASLKSTAKAMGGVAAGTNAAKKALAGFDTINTLDTSSGSGGGSASPPSLAYEASNPFLDSLTDAIKGGDWAGAGTMLADKLNSIIAGWDAYGWGQKLGGMLQNGISFAFSFLTTFDWNGLGAKLAGFVNGLLNQVDGAQLGALFASKFTIEIGRAHV